MVTHLTHLTQTQHNSQDGILYQKLQIYNKNIQ